MHQFIIHSLFFLIIFNVVLSHALGLSNLCYLIAGFYMLYMFSHVSITGIKRSNRFLLVFLIFFFMIFILNIFAAFHSLNNTITMFLSFLWIPIFMLLFSSLRNIKFDLNKFLRFQLHLAIIVAVFGIVEFFLSRDLYNLVPRVGFDALYDDFSLFYRTRSILYSTQVNALFCILYLIILLEMKTLNFKPLIRIIYLIILTVASILTASKSVVFLLFIYMIIKLYNKKLLMSFVLISLVWLGNSLGTKNIDFEHSHMRLFSIFLDSDNLIPEEKSNRLMRYLKLIDASNIIYGNGLGSTYSKNLNYINPESYLLQLYSEGGIITLFLFLLFLGNKYYISNSSNKIIIFIITLSLSFVHAFASPVFFGVWSFIVMRRKRYEYIN